MPRQKKKSNALPIAARPLVVPRLYDRRMAAAYLSMSPAMLDELRHAGEIVPVPVPSNRAPGGVSRTPLFDRADLDKAIERWKGRSDAA